MHGDAADVSQRYLRLAQRLVDDRKEALEVRPRGHLRHDAAEAGVQVGLRRDDAGQHARLVGENGGGGLVATGFEGEEEGHSLASASMYIAANRGKRRRTLASSSKSQARPLGFVGRLRGGRSLVS